jgi:ketosteroid isomerase-like protein
MHAWKSLGLSLLVAATSTTATLAHEPKSQSGAGPPAGSAAAVGGPASAVEGFHLALASGDREGALSWLDPEAVVFESGGAEMSRDEYASHHLESDMEFTRAVKTEVLARHAHSAGDAAWVLSLTRTTGRFRERDVDADGVETMVLRRVSGQWRIVHVHWSSHARKSD